MSRFLLLLLLASFAIACRPAQPSEVIAEDPPVSNKTVQPILHEITSDITMGAYFEYLDSVVQHYDSLLSHTITEYLIVRANPWLIDTLENTDYYRLMDRGIFEYDPQSLLAFRRGQSLKIPDAALADSLTAQMEATTIDVNIPEYKLRILLREKVLYTFPVRVGRNETKYLAMAGRDADLRTRTGRGTIVRIDRNPAFINPTNNKRYEVTRRDDDRITKLPRIPWLEPELDGLRHGQLIHPTTNPKTLGKAYSNGCIGMKEADIWRVYYHAPVGTRIVFRYDLGIVNERGDSIHLPDIYPQDKHRMPEQPVASAPVAAGREGPCDCYCSVTMD